MIIDKSNYSIEVFHSPEKIFDFQDKATNRLENLKYAVSQTKISGVVLEFGVWKGTTINTISNKLPSEIIYGFDSFEGLPEDWNISTNEKFNKHKKGFFSVDELPIVNKNVKLIKGFFDQTLISWINQHSPDRIKLIHIDSDLYSSAKYVLTTLNNLIVPGTIIVFDEFYPWSSKRYETWAEHEYKALQEWIEENNRQFKILSRSAHQQCSIEIVK